MQITLKFLLNVPSPSPPSAPAGEDESHHDPSLEGTNCSSPDDTDRPIPADCHRVMWPQGYTLNSAGGSKVSLTKL